MNNKQPTQTQQPSTSFQSIDAAQLDAILGGCGCGQANCANGSCSTSTSPGVSPGGATQRPFGWFR